MLLNQLLYLKSMPAVRLRTGGKGDFVKRRLSDGSYEPICLCTYNADFSIRGCMAQVHEDYLEDVIKNNGSYSKELIPEIQKAGLMDSRCMYCYAKRHNWGQATPLEVNNITKNDFEVFNPEYVRIGKNTECGHFLYHNLMLDFFDMCADFNSGVIFPTKALEFNKDTVESLLRIKHVINYSIGNDGLEGGLVSQGYTNKFRVNEAVKYHKAGVHSTLTVVCDVTSSFEENDKRGFAVFDALKAHWDYNIPLRILPLRLNTHKLAPLSTGKSWKTLLESKNQQLMDFEVSKKEDWTFYSRVIGSGDLDPRYFHPDFLDFVEDGIGVCGRVGRQEENHAMCEHCDKCDLTTDRIVFPASELPKIKTNKDILMKNRTKRNKKKKKEKQQEGQLNFDLQ